MVYPINLSHGQHPQIQRFVCLFCFYQGDAGRHMEEFEKVQNIKVIKFRFQKLKDRIRKIVMNILLEIRREKCRDNKKGNKEKWKGKEGKHQEIERRGLLKTDCSQQLSPSKWTEYLYLSRFYPTYSFHFLSTKSLKSTKTLIQTSLTFLDLLLWRAKLSSHLLFWNLSENSPLLHSCKTLSLPPTCSSISFNWLTDLWKPHIFGLMTGSGNK